jgi:predicted RNase H-like nuclease (RuvC/YqgF family)
LKEERAAAVAERDRLAAKLGAADAEAAADKGEELSKLESLLAERGEHIRKIEADLREAERVGKELVKELAREALSGGTAEHPGRDGAQATQVEALTAENARLRADLQAAEWTVQELENRLDRALRRPAEAPGAEPPEKLVESDASR